MLVVFCFLLFSSFFFSRLKKRGGSVSKWLERWTYHSEAPSLSPALPASWICSL